MSSHWGLSSLVDMRVVFAGSPDVARIALDALIEADIPLVGVISQPDRPVGRKKTITPTPVSIRARDAALDLFRPVTQAELVDAVTTLQPDLVIVVAYGRLIGAEALEIPLHGWWNLHFSLLPSYRGATPVQHALLAGDRTTGVSVFQIDTGLDTGDVLGQRPVAIEPFVTAGELLETLAHEGASLLVELFHALEQGQLEARAQHGEVSLAPKLPADAGRLDFHQSVADVFRRWQAVTPEPGAYTTLRDREGRLVIRHARPAPDVVDLSVGQLELRGSKVFVGCGRGALELIRVHPSGKKEMSAADWARGLGHAVHCGQ